MRRFKESVWKSAMVGLLVGLFILLFLTALDNRSSIVSEIKTLLNQSTAGQWLAEGHNAWHKIVAIPLNDGLVLTFSIGAALVVAFVLAFQSENRQPLVSKIWPLYPQILDGYHLESRTDHLPLVSQRPSFQGKDGLLKELILKISAAKGPSYIVVKGEAGSGKTRLGIELIRSLRLYGWDSGFLKADAGPEEIKSATLRRRTLIIIDDADLRGDAWSILNALVARDRRIVVVLTAECLAEGRPGKDMLSDPGRARLIQEVRLTKLPYLSLQAIKPTASVEELQKCEGNPGSLLYVTEGKFDARYYAKQTYQLAKRVHLIDALTLSVFCGPVRLDKVPEAVMKRNPSIVLGMMFRDVSPRLLENAIPKIQPSLVGTEIAFRLLQEMDDEKLTSLVQSLAPINPHAFQARVASMLKSQWPSEARRATAEKLQDLFSQVVPAIGHAYEEEALSINKLIASNADSIDYRWAADRLEEIWLANPADANLFACYGESIPRIQEKLCELGLFDDAREVFQRFYDYAYSKNLPKLKRFSELRRIAMACMLVTYNRRVDDALAQSMHVRCKEEMEAAIGDVQMQNAASSLHLILAMIADSNYRRAEDELETLNDMALEFIKHPACEASVQVHRLFLDLARSANATNYFGKLYNSRLIDAWLERAKTFSKHPTAGMDSDVLMQEAHMSMELMLTNASLGKMKDMEEAAKQFRSLAARIPVQNRRGLEPLWSTMAGAAISAYRERGRVSDVQRWAKNLMSMPTDKATTKQNNKTEIILSEMRMIYTVVETFLENNDPDSAEHWVSNIFKNRMQDQECPQCDELQLRTTLRMITYYSTRDFNGLLEWGKKLASLLEWPASRWNPDMVLVAVEGVRTIITAALVHEKQEVVTKWQDTADALSVRFGDQPEVRRVYEKLKTRRQLLNA